MNISTVLIEFGNPYIDGYNLLRNFHTLLNGVADERLLGAVWTCTKRQQLR